MNRPLTIFHRNCHDGFGAAYAIWRAHGYRPEYRTANYGEQPPLDVDNRDVWIVDFSYTADQLDAIAKRARNVLVIDHHKSAKDELAAVTANNVEVIFNEEKSGARLTWERFHRGKPVPFLLQLVEDRDLWRYRFDETQAIALLLASYPYEFERWDSVRKNIESAVFEAKGIERYHEQKISHLVAHHFMAPLAGYSIPVCNAPGFFASDLGNKLASVGKFACVFWYGGKTWTYSLRTQDPDFDVSKIAESYGGGGHRAAAGFKSEKLLF